jgi:S1-C subfamily serine protease
MRFRLRTLFIALAIVPPILAPASIWCWREYVAWRNMRAAVPVPGGGYLGAILEGESAAPGVEVIGVRPASPAESGGLLTKDIIVSINNRRCRNFDDLDSVLAKVGPGSKLLLTVRRADKSQTLTVTLGNRPVGR